MIIGYGVPVSDDIPKWLCSKVEDGTRFIMGDGDFRDTQEKINQEAGGHPRE